jgi:5-methyltetrahydropteroyltriglutamate--homocysteine methyltransferase
MSKNYIIGYPRIGENRELKFALENYWSGKSDLAELEKTAAQLRRRHWVEQKSAGIDAVSCNDFSYYDGMLDTCVMLGAIPERFRDIGDPAARYFAMVRGDKERTAMQMTKWFNTNYHYIVPEFAAGDTFEPNAEKIINEYREAKGCGVTPKINLIGPLTFLGLGKNVDTAFDRYTHFDAVLNCYERILETIGSLDEAVTVQIDEPILVTGPDARQLSLLKLAYDRLAAAADSIEIIVATYFEHACEAVDVLAHTPIGGIALDFVHGPRNTEALQTIAESGKTLVAGVIDGRNVWRSDLDAVAETLESIAQTVPKEQITVSSSCSLLHVPYSLDAETKLDAEIVQWLAFAKEKLAELNLVSKRFCGETLDDFETRQLEQSRAAVNLRKHSTRIHDPEVRARVNAQSGSERALPYEERIKLQHEALDYPLLPTTTIGSFPQTPELRALRRDYKRGDLDAPLYEAGIKAYIDDCIAFQESIGLDVLVHGEPERNDMVEYFGEQLDGFAFSANGWVQSYGSRCVKPPLIYGDVSRPKPMTVGWTTYAQSKTDKIVKGMLTGPVTILNWSFVRNDLPRADVAEQIALAIGDEVDDLQNAGIRIIQVDEAAFKEGYPLRRENIGAYETWAVDAFRRSVACARSETQIHTHMCYSQFNDIIHTIEAMDADVISIETARSGNALLRIFKEVGYKQEVGPGVYDIHSPRVPPVAEMAAQINALLEVLPKEQLWINPDCGLKTRKWEEVKPSLANMVDAVKEVRASFDAIIASKKGDAPWTNDSRSSTATSGSLR